MAESEPVVKKSDEEKATDEEMDVDEEEKPKASVKKIKQTVGSSSLGFQP